MAIRKSAFTVVELLVVISIIALLMGLILPAIVAVKETMRRTQCLHQQAELYKGVAQYESAHGQLPPGRGFANLPATAYTKPANWDTPGQTVTWVYFTLPYLERQTLKDQVDGILKSGGSLNMLASVAIKLLHCPSDATDQNPLRISYAPNMGLPDVPITNNLALPFDWAANGALVTRLKGTNPAEVQKLEQQSLGDISNGDGTTNTILLSENHYLDAWNYVTNEFQVGILWQETPASPPRLGLDQPFLPGPQSDVSHARPSSLHPGGFVMVKCDGSAKFVSNTIDYNVYCQLMTSNSQRYKSAGATTAIPAVQAAQQLPLSDESY